MATYAEQLTEVQTAITNVLTHGQYIMKDGRAMTQTSLDQLQKRELYLISMVSREANNGGVGAGARVRGITPT